MTCFLEKYIGPRTGLISNRKEFNDIGREGFEAYMVGSDQVWRAQKYSYIKYAFLGFVSAKNAKRIAYAASFGVDKWEFTPRETKRFRRQIKRFDNVSVREDSGVQLCAEYFSIRALHVLDPTMLLSVKDYLKLVEAENEQEVEGDLFVYILDDNEDKAIIATKICSATGLNKYEANKKKLTDNVSKNELPTVTSWIRGVSQAKYVLTDSFHGCVFSILFNKPFIAVGNKARGLTRFESLLRMFGLSNRLITASADARSELFFDEIDWDHVNHLLQNHRVRSKQFLENALK